jgi:hypothetical protein
VSPTKPIVSQYNLFAPQIWFIWSKEPLETKKRLLTYFFLSALGLTKQGQPTQIWKNFFSDSYLGGTFNLPILICLKQCNGNQLNCIELRKIKCKVILGITCSQWTDISWFFVFVLSVMAICRYFFNLKGNDFISSFFTFRKVISDQVFDNHRLSLQIKSEEAF